jgi:hypothetical protein
MEPSAASPYSAGMTEATYYRDEARRLRTLARAGRNRPSATRWSALADEYEQLAASLERSSSPRIHRVPLPQQPQTVQQQQGRLKPQ